MHLASWPSSDPALADPRLSEQMALVRRLVELGRASRARSSVRTRQPLRRALISAAGWTEADRDLQQHVADELNVLSLESLDDGSAGLVDISVKANFRSLGQRFAKQTPLVASAISANDAAALVYALRTQGAVEIAVADVGVVAITADDVVITETPREGLGRRDRGRRERRPRPHPR